MTNIEAFRPSLKTRDIDPAQLRAARGFLGWTRSDLARKTGLSAETIKNTEYGTYLPKEETVKAITAAFAKHGVEMICYESVSTIPADETAPSHTLKISYSCITSMTASVHENVEDGRK